MRDYIHSVGKDWVMGSTDEPISPPEQDVFTMVDGIESIEHLGYPSRLEFAKDYNARAANDWFGWDEV